MTGVTEVHLRLAAEEGIPKDRFEKEYDDNILGTNYPATRRTVC
jgi:hypothetical protein